MNSQKLTNILLIALIVINGLFLGGWILSSMHQGNGREFAMHNKFRGRFHGRSSFHQCFGACRSSHGGCYGGFRNYDQSGANQYSNVN